ncbi:sensor histidine kinase [Clostridium puniceum]|nr:histidine kinase [Clostridium puniceum]
MVNDYTRKTKLTINSGYMYNTSLLFTIFGASILTYFIRGFETNVFMTFPLAELLQSKGIRLKILLLIHFLLYLMLLITDIGMSNYLYKLPSLLPALFGYFALCSTMYSEKIFRAEKDEVNKLNEKLQLANIKLQQYALEVEALTVSKERTTMAQELHDSVGHTLIALIMHLEFATKMCDIKPTKVKDVLIKAEYIAKSSINSLRDVVSLLKEEREIEFFNDSIKSIINNFHLLNNIKINFNTDEDLDNLSSIIKNSMCSTIKESITNSIKHGKATEITIKILRKNNNINLILTDNGIGCNKIIKSTGLLGIENRVTSLNGSVNYFSNDNFGFGMYICIPVLTEEI